MACWSLVLRALKTIPFDHCCTNIRCEQKVQILPQTFVLDVRRWDPSPKPGQKNGLTFKNIALHFKTLPYIL